MKKFFVVLFVLFYIVNLNGQYKNNAIARMAEEKQEEYVRFYYNPHDFSFRYGSANFNELKISLKNEVNDNGVLISLDVPNLQSFLLTAETNRNGFLVYCNASTTVKKRITNRKVVVNGFFYSESADKEEEPYIGYVITMSNKKYFLDKKYIRNGSSLMSYLNKVNQYYTLKNDYRKLCEKEDYLKEKELHRDIKCDASYLAIEKKYLAVNDSLDRWYNFEKNIYENELKKEYKERIEINKDQLKNDSIRLYELQHRKRNNNKLKNYLSDINYWVSKPNSAAGCDFHFQAFNENSKTIKYIYLTVRFKNAVNDFVSSEIANQSIFNLKITGPIEHGLGDDSMWEAVIYNWSTKTAIITSLKIQYMDNSTITFTHNDILIAQKETEAENEENDLIEKIKIKKNHIIMAEKYVQDGMYDKLQTAFYGWEWERLRAESSTTDKNNLSLQYEYERKKEWNHLNFQKEIQDYCENIQKEISTQIKAIKLSKKTLILDIVRLHETINDNIIHGNSATRSLISKYY